VQSNHDERACAICQATGMTAVTWNNVPLCETHWQEREDMQLGSDQMFRHRAAIEAFRRTVQAPQSASAA